MRTFIFFLLLLGSCKFSETVTTKADYELIKGKTMGTTYSIKYEKKEEATISKTEVDSILVSINAAVSTYEPESTISLFNQSVDTMSFPQHHFPTAHFLKNVDISALIYEDTKGKFDPTVMPLVNYWGFGYTEKKAVEKADSLAIEDMMKSVGLSKLKIQKKENRRLLEKPNKNMALDFSAIAKGYAVDFLAQTLWSKGIRNFMVEIGGEVHTRGVNDKGETWKIGINKPESEAALNSLEWVVALENTSMASSGNYRNFYEVDGKKYGHELNPLTGYPEVTTLLGVSVIHSECMYADAFATAYMVMGLEESLKHAESNAEIEACFISSDGDKLTSVFTTGFKSYLHE